MENTFRLTAAVWLVVAICSPALLPAQETGETSILDNARPLVVGGSVSLQS